MAQNTDLIYEYLNSVSLKKPFHPQTGEINTDALIEIQEQDIPVLVDIIERLYHIAVNTIPELEDDNDQECLVTQLCTIDEIIKSCDPERWGDTKEI